MLKALSVRNFALVESINLEFKRGLNILTGETGSGKSILIDALGLILGDRASVDYIRHSCDTLRVEAVFDISDLHEVKTVLNDQEIPYEEDQALIISRRLGRGGKNSILVNGCHVTLNVLRLLGQKLVDIHGQHENQALLRQETYLGFIDSHNPQIAAYLDRYQQIYQQWVHCLQEYDTALNSTRERMQRLDILKWQTQEIAAAGLTADEEEQLDQQIKLQANAEKISSGVAKAYGLLSQGNKGYGGIVAGMAEVRREIDTAARYDQRLETMLAVIADCLYQLEELSRDLRDYTEQLEFEPQTLAKLQERMDVIYKLKRKYGATLPDVINYYEQALAELQTIENSDQRIAQLAQRKVELEAELSELAASLDELRSQAAASLEAEIGQHLQDLGMRNAKMLVRINKLTKFTPKGCNEAELLFSANPGEEPRLLNKVVSGGELSRIALAIKAISASRDDVGTMIFDEVDAGIGGQTGQMVAEKIALVAAQTQVLCITHLPQIACMADQHIYVEKLVEQDRTFAQARTLDAGGRLHEIARMISGNNFSQAAINNAADMLQCAKKIKEKWKNKA